MSEPRFQFGQIVVVEEECVGVVVKAWTSKKHSFVYEVYVRSFNTIQEYPENEIMQYIFHKELYEWEQDYYWEEYKHKSRLKDKK